jgi:hypothetical protein
MTVEKDISVVKDFSEAPAAGERTIPAYARAPAASGVATTL